MTGADEAVHALAERRKVHTQGGMRFSAHPAQTELAESVGRHRRPGTGAAEHTRAQRPSQVPVTQRGDATELAANAIAAESLARGTVVPSGLDLSTVRIHAGPAASRAARALNANAYAFGDDVVLGDVYEAGSARGHRLLAHELAHVSQHRRRGGPPVLARDNGPDPDPHHRLAHIQLVNVDDLHAMGARDVKTEDTPAAVTPKARGEQVEVQDDDRNETRFMRDWEVRASTHNVDNGLVSVKPQGDFWSLELQSLTFEYKSGSHLTIPWNELDFARRPSATQWRLIKGVLYPLIAGRQTFDETNTPNVMFAAQMVLDYVTKALRDRRVNAETVFSFNMAIAQLGGAVGPGDWLAATVPRGTVRPVRPSAVATDALDAELERSFQETFTEPAEDLPSSGPVVEPEIAYGFTRAEVGAARRLIGRPIDGVGVLGRVWRRVTNAGEQAQLTLQNSRRLFDNQRGRFWRAVRADPAARAEFENAGFRFSGSNETAPVRQLSDGSSMQATIDHIVERQTDPTRALDPTNLRVSTRLENTVVLRQVTAQDPFQ